MPRVRTSAWTWLKGAAFAAAVLLGPSRALAAPGAFVSSPGGGRVQPDEELSLSWRLDPAATRGRDEMELVLSLDGGVTFPIRVTGRLEPGSTGLRWRVPGLPTEHARLGLRAGEDDRPDSEEILAVSDPFVIASAELDGIEELYAVADEWRTREALEGAPVRPLPREIESRDGDGQLVPTDLDADESETVSPADDGQRGDDPGSKAEAAPRPADAPAVSVCLRSPLPLRL